MTSFYGEYDYNKLAGRERAARRDAAVKQYGEELGRSLIEYVNNPKGDAGRAFAERIVASLESENAQQKTTAVMALMNAFKLIMEDKIDPVRRTANRASREARPLFRRIAS
ncbi:MAG: hypothetical protein A2958_00550 [Candidatus Levybacteria bacterium RIFCSPLOWO2_01_FULL_38_13]|nr:MAG: hypothetical protein A2629_02570 [Candidatus Levybacteria bacterium RIFCSPHIGHO2_01_FULL_41_15]OGH34779.1 MAG: hypothetical protein A2958_00550 [Candidatus Levybacteria bacterium RIFCSPLOWO2_01_FULL_38_13]